MKLIVEELYNPNGDTIKRGYKLIGFKEISPTVLKVHTSNGLASSLVGDEFIVSDLFKLVKQNDENFKPKTASRVVNDDGTPMRVYHGTSDDFTEFKHSELRDREGSFFFAQNYEDAAAYSGNGTVMEEYINLQNPIDYNNMPSEINRLPNKREQVEALKKLDYDGWIADMEDGWGEISAFYPNQIKSATDNIGTFDKNNPDTRYSVDKTEFKPKNDLTDNHFRKRAQIGALTDRVSKALGGADKPSVPRYSIAGENAKTANINLLETAKQMEKEGRSKEDIFKETGWYRGTKGRWRFEIDDGKAEFVRKGVLSNPDVQRFRELENSFINGTISNQEQRELSALIKTLKGVRKTPKYLSEFLIFDSLFEAYPQLRNVEVRFNSDMPQNIRGRYLKNENIIELNASLNDVEGLSTLLHEVQHNIQNIEGFEGGANVEEIIYKKQQAKEARDVLNWIKGLKWTQAENPDIKDILELNNILREEYAEMDMLELIPSGELQAEAMDKYYSESAIAELENKVNQYGLNKSIDGYNPYQMYKNTAGEIEAREVQNRHNLPTDEKRNNIPFVADENTVFITDADVVYYASDDNSNISIKEQIVDNLESLNSMEAVDNIQYKKRIAKKTLKIL